ncbi:hypothetical protein GCM10020331_030900 [Ectobacillus funiculus]
MIKFLSNMGYGSRKRSKKLLKEGAVQVDGVPVKDAKQHVDVNEQEVTVHGEVVEYKEFVYLLMHKPPGVISATEDDVHETVIDLLEHEDLIFLNHFLLAVWILIRKACCCSQMMGICRTSCFLPKKHVPKKYYAHVRGRVTEEDIEAFRKGVVLDDDYETKPAELTIFAAWGNVGN